MMKEEKRCVHCGGEVLGTLCDTCYAQVKLDLERRNTSPVAGHCHKCGAPYTLNPDGSPQPICVCWNLPRMKTTTGTGT